MRLALLFTLVAVFLGGLAGVNCSPSAPNELDQLGTMRLSIKGQEFELWVADEISETTRGLMYVTAEQMAPLADGTERGMIFIFSFEQQLAFWMKNTIIPLDIAYLKSDGTVVSVHTMAAMDTASVPSAAPARFAIEVNADVFISLGVQPGDKIALPATTP